MLDLQSSSDFPLTLVSREDEIKQASDVAAANEHVRQFFEAVLKKWGALHINNQVVFWEGKEEIDLAYRLFLGSSQTIQDYRRRQAKSYLREGELHLTAA